MQKKRLVLVLVLALGAITAAQAQKRWVFSPEATVGVGLKNGPASYTTAAFTVGYKIGDLFLLGAGAGFRSAFPTSRRTTIDSSGALQRETKEMMVELEMPVFLRIGLEGSKWFVHVDGGYAVGLFGVSAATSLLKGASPYINPIYKGLFVDPHAGIILGGRHAIGLGVLFQQCTRQEEVINQSKDVISTSVNTVKEFPAAINLRYGFRF